MREGIHLADNPEAEADGYSGDLLWDGLGLIDYHFVPHFRCDHPESLAMEDVVAFHELKGNPYHSVEDGQVIIDRTHGHDQGDVLENHS